MVLLAFVPCPKFTPRKTYAQNVRLTSSRVGHIFPVMVKQTKKASERLNTRRVLTTDAEYKAAIALAKKSRRSFSSWTRDLIVVAIAAENRRTA